MTRASDVVDERIVVNSVDKAVKAVAMLASTMEQQTAVLRDAFRDECLRAGDHVRGSGEAAGKAFGRHMTDATEQARRATDALTAAQGSYLSQRRRVWIVVGGVLGLCLLTLVVTWQAAAGYYHERLATLRAEVQYMDAIHRSDVVPCGDGKLCASVDVKAGRFGERKQYYIVKPRP